MTKTSRWGSQNYCHLPDLLLLTVHFVAWIFPGPLIRIWLGSFLLKYWPWVLCESAMFTAEDWAWGFSRKTITVLPPSPTTFQLDTLLSANRAFRAVSAAAGCPATGILKRVTDQTVASNFSVRPAGCTPGHVFPEREREVVIAVTGHLRPSFNTHSINVAQSSRLLV